MDCRRPRGGSVPEHGHRARRLRPPPLATDRVRFVGEAIVAVVAETVMQANDAADMVIVDYEPLPAVVRPRRRWPRTRPCCSKHTATTSRSPTSIRSTTDRSATPT